MSTVIIGSGIIGASIAYYLSEESSDTQPSEIHLVESSPELFASASGYAGGFLARDWFSPAAASLGALSFDLHKALAEQHDGPNQWGYHRTTTVSLGQANGLRDDEWLREGRSRIETAPVHEAEVRSGPSWLKKTRHGDIEPISEGDTTAQVNPLRLCQFLLRTCQSRGVHLHHPSTPSSIHLSSSGSVESITVESTSTPEQHTIPCTRLVLAAGAWTPRVYSTLFPTSSLKIPVSSLAGHSLVLRSPHWKSGDELDPGKGAHAIYTTDESGFSPEIFARAGGEIYIAGVNNAGIPLPERPTDRVLDGASIRRLRKTAEGLMGLDKEEGGLEAVREGLCWRPVTGRGTPILDKVGEGIWVAVGHGPWGISLSLGTGKVLAEMIEGKETSTDVSRLRL
ncbi:MAG: hypothetical protein MMC23_005227 [Stictis urceolatum]|nr:hypothetical protein [Stictis urceolata]